MQDSFDVIIIGGGLAGLSLAIQLADTNFTVAVLERNKYPIHRVCGEYISMESWNFLERTGMPMREMQLPFINELHVSSVAGKILTHPLNPGGFGISRYLLDATLANIARAKGAVILENCKVEDYYQQGESFTVAAGEKKLKGKIVIGAFGKRSNMDKKLQRSGFDSANSITQNWVGVKYHIKSTLPDHVIQLHNFDGGYCGISKVEGEQHCLCYLTKAENLKRFAGNIRQMEDQLLSVNPFLSKIFESRSAFLFDAPETISQINFENKLPVEKNMLMAGDAAGLITPLCGNGMSMALRASVICFFAIEKFLSGKISRKEMEIQYAADWRREFSFRLKAGRFLQPLLVNSSLSKPAIALLKHFPIAVKQIVGATHGKSF
ncbi:MAG: NAD(P)/FAD-dependent oxidoreductase [Chitinophagales bacterium]